MTWSLAVVRILGLFVHIDAQKDPTEALLAVLLVGLALWFIVAQARNREERRAESRRDRGNRPPRSW